MTLEQLLLSARALELSEKQANEIEHKDEKLETNALHKKRNVRRNQPRYLQDKRPEQRVNRKTTNVGIVEVNFHTEGNVLLKENPAIFVRSLTTSRRCVGQKRNTNTKRSVNTLENSDFENNFECQSKIDSSSDDEYVFGLQTESTKGTVNSIKRDQPRICVKINESNINVLIDTGSSINISLGKFDTVIETRDKLTNATVYVSKGTSGNLLCYDTSLELQIIPQISRALNRNKHELLCEQYKDIFHGLGKLKDTQVKIHIDNTVKSIVQPHRRIPFHVRKQVEAELERLERLDIIERVHGPTPWVSPIVVAPKPKSPGEIRICVDMRLPNQAIQRERHITPTIDDLIVDLNGAKVFSKMDLLNGYHQLELTQESRNITTFYNTCWTKKIYSEYSTITEPLRRLTKQGVTWTWTSEQQQSFDALKQELMNNRIMAYFDPRKATVLIVDASPVGVGALLTQDGKVNAYASRALSDVEKRYSQTEREGLAIVWAIEHFHLYLYGHKFTLVTDHQPLEYIFNNPKSKPPARIQRWRLRLQTYDFDVKYKSGKSNAADYMSRHPNINEANRTDHYDVAENL
ncbi:unnamed protein product [Mytilus coruscus]|uniref:Reverse transcriptase RNase H-like domain-containing protein n=1 Tax=Mytilus coruscus TaxID=42192 RepID=A0A6J8AWR4_MYTCO|nr:unnamed protein product [Mytilus coruscus]